MGLGSRDHMSIGLLINGHEKQQAATRFVVFLATHFLFVVVVEMWSRRSFTQSYCFHPVLLFSAIDDRSIRTKGAIVIY